MTTPSTTTKTTTTTKATIEVPTKKSGNTYVDAISLTIGERAEKSITYLDDNDNCLWYIVNISEDGLLSLTLNASAGVYCNISLICINNKLILNSYQLYTFDLTMDSDLKAKMFVIASDGATEIYSDYGKNKEINLTCPLQSGTYYIRIECLENYGGYQLQINSVEIKNLDSEPNNTYQKSIEAKSDETISGSIGFVNDKKEYDQYDWYCFNINERKHVIISTNSPEPFQYEVRLIGADGEQTLSYITVVVK